SLKERCAIESTRNALRLTPLSLTACLGHRHHFQQVSIRIFEVKSAAATPVVDTAVVVAVRAAAVGDAFGFDPSKDGIEVGVAEMEGVVVALASARIVAAVAPAFGAVAESQREAVIHLHAGEESAADFQSENFGEKPGGSKCIFSRYDRVV